MAFTIGAVAAKDGAGSTVTGGLLAADTVGGGAGPWFLFNSIVDGVAGVNKVQIDSSNRMAVLATQTGTWSVSINGTAAVTQSGTWNVGLSAGANVVGKVGIDQTTPGTTNLVAAGQSGTWTVQPGNTANTTAWLMKLDPTSPGVQIVAGANGLTSSRVVSAASTNATSLKASAGNVVNIDVFNEAAYDVFLKFYNKASAPTVGADTPVLTLPIKSGQGYARTFPVGGKAFATGVAYAITKLQADGDATAIAAGDVTGAIDWV